MKRSEKYRETSSFVYFNANPRNRVTSDCVIRAISAATQIPYRKVVMEMAELQCDTGYDSGENRVIDMYLSAKGWKKQKQPRHDDNTKYTGKQFCDYLSINHEHGEIGNVICNIGGHHIVAIMPTNHGDGFNCRYKVHDIWDSTDGCIGNYWVKEALT